MRLQIVLLVVAAAVLATAEAVSAMDSNGLQMVSPNAPLQTHADEGKRLLRSETTDEDDDVSEDEDDESEDDEDESEDDEDESEDDEDESEDDEDERMYTFKANSPSGLAKGSANIEKAMTPHQKKLLRMEEIEKKSVGNTDQASKLNIEKESLRKILDNEGLTVQELKMFKESVKGNEGPYEYISRSMIFMDRQSRVERNRENEQFVKFYRNAVEFTLHNFQDEILHAASKAKITNEKIGVFNREITSNQLTTPASVRVGIPSRITAQDSESFSTYYGIVMDITKKLL